MKKRFDFRSLILKSGYVVLVSAIALGLLEFVARQLGLGDPIIYYSSPWGGLRPLPDQKVSRLNGSTVTIDANGFRSTGPDSENAIRILYLGDSVTWGGSSVDDTELFSEVAADVLRSNGLEVYAMNAGVNGTSLLNQAEIFLQWQDSVDVVVWLFPWGDVHRTYVTAGYLWPPTKSPSFALVEAIDHVIRTRWLTLFRENASATDAEFLLPETPAGYEQLFGAILDERTRQNVQTLIETVKIGREKGIPVIAGITPRRDGIELLKMPTEAKETMRQLEMLNAHIMDVNAVFPTGENLKSAYIDQIHFTASGHRLTGEALGKLLLTVMNTSAADTGNSK